MITLAVVTNWDLLRVRSEAKGQLRMTGVVAGMNQSSCKSERASDSVRGNRTPESRRGSEPLSREVDKLK